MTVSLRDQRQKSSALVKNRLRTGATSRSQKFCRDRVSLTGGAYNVARNALDLYLNRLSVSLNLRTGASFDTPFCDHGNDHRYRHCRQGLANGLDLDIPAISGALWTTVICVSSRKTWRNASLNHLRSVVAKMNEAGAFCLGVRDRGAKRYYRISRNVGS